MIILIENALLARRIVCNVIINSFAKLVIQAFINNLEHVNSVIQT